MVIHYTFTSVRSGLNLFLLETDQSWHLLQSYLCTGVEERHCVCLLCRVKPWWNDTNIDENKQRSQSDCWHESHYVLTVPANPQLNPECDTECERQERRMSKRRKRWCGSDRKSLVRNEVLRVCVCAVVCMSPLLPAPQLVKATACERTGSRGDCGGVSVYLCVSLSVKDEQAV